MTRAPLSKAVSQLLWSERIARCGFPWEKTTKRPVASVYTNCETALTVPDLVHFALPRETSGLDP
jgi:hypothetical protein